MNRATTSQLTVTLENYFDLALVLHIFLTLNHEGQGSVKYRLLSTSPFKPGPLFSADEWLKENWNSWRYDEMSEMTDEALEQLHRDLKGFLTDYLQTP